jgi:hypothetical protein
MIHRPLREARMAETRFKPKAYLKDGCPYSFKLLLFLAEARLLDGVDVVRCDPDGDEFERIRQRLSGATGKPATFPTVEMEPGRHVVDSDRLIEHFARVHGVAADALPALAFYRQTIFPQLEGLHGE